jgi:hypothetical protein
MPGDPFLVTDEHIQINRSIRYRRSPVEFENSIEIYKMAQADLNLRDAAYQGATFDRVVLEACAPQIYKIYRSVFNRPYTSWKYDETFVAIALEPIRLLVDPAISWVLHYEQIEPTKIPDPRGNKYHPGNPIVGPQNSVIYPRARHLAMMVAKSLSQVDNRTRDKKWVRLKARAIVRMANWVIARANWQAQFERIKAALPPAK